jgi:hypothetical protein
MSLRFNAKGDLIVAAAHDTPARLPVGTDGYILTADATSPLGIKWSAATGGGLAATIIDAKGDLIVGTAADTAGRLAAGTDGQVLAADSGAATGLAWTAAPGGGIPATLVNAKGDLIVATADDTVARKAAGTNGHALVADSAQSDGLKYARRRPALAYRTGKFYGPRSGTVTPIGWAVGQMTFVPYMISEDSAWDRIAIYVNSAVGGSTHRLGIYADHALGGPGALVLDAGNIATATAQEWAVTIAQTLTAGPVWLAQNPQVTPGTLLSVSLGWYEDVGSDTTYNAGGANGVYATGVATGALPADAHALTLAAHASPALIWLRKA